MLAMFVAAVVAGLAGPAPREITAPGPKGALAGTLIEAKRGAPVVLIIPGSGPTDRDGNNPLGVTAGSYRLLAEALARKGVSSVRIDKRGMFGSKAAVPDANAVTIDTYAEDIRVWMTAVRAATGAKCVWLAGHSEGSLVALTAAQKPAGMCGVVSIAGPGRPLGLVLREQLRGNPANAALLPPELAAIDRLERGERVDVSGMAPPLQQLFAPQVQAYLSDLLPRDPAKLAATLTLPLLVIQGDRDVQVSAAKDAAALKSAQPAATLVIVAGMNHVLKLAPADLRGNVATYADPSLPVVPSLVDAVAAFVKRRR